MLLSVIFLIIGLVILIVGAEGMVRGASAIAKKLGISPLVIGLTIVAFGTSAPELFVNIYSAFNGSADIAIGNIVGSNIANILLILGLCALVYPLSLKKNTVWKEIPLALLAIVLVFVMGNDAMFDGMGFNILTRTDGIALIALFFIFLYYTFGISKTKGSDENDEVKSYSWLIAISFTLFGLLGLVYGGKLLVDNAIILARLAGMSEALIGLTIVAVGTSLPELATSLVAVLRKQNDIAVGNVVGSNIFNTLWVLGATSSILHLPFSITVNFDVMVNIVATMLLFLFMFVDSRHKLNRWQGGMFVVLYIVYIIYLIWRG